MVGTLDTATRKRFNALDQKDPEAILSSAANDVQTVDESSGGPRWT